jgi:pimeloyl-ACP methyl ester carboxylesterase
MRLKIPKWVYGSRKRLCFLFGFGVVLWLLSSYAVAYKLSRRPQSIFPEPVPALSWGKVEPFQLLTSDGEELGAWFIDGRADQPLVLLLHGYGCCRTHFLGQAKLLADAGCPVLLISLRAHGDSTGEVNDIGLSARKDVVAAVEWLRAKHPNRPVVVWGQSLGSAAAVFAAEELGQRVQGYILECPYRDLRTAVRNRCELYLPPILSDLAYAGLSTVSPIILPDVDRISPVDSAASIPASARILVLAGAADRLARPEEARAIFEQVKSHARLVMIEGGDHGQLATADAEGFRAAVLGLVAECRSAGIYR